MITAQAKDYLKKYTATNAKVNEAHKAIVEYLASLGINSCVDVPEDIILLDEFKALSIRLKKSIDEDKKFLKSLIGKEYLKTKKKIYRKTSYKERQQLRLTH